MSQNKEYRKEYRAKNKEKLAKKWAEYYTENKDKCLESRKKYRAENKEELVKRRAKHYAENREKIIKKSKMKKYNLTSEQYDHLVLIKNCMICGCVENSKSLHIDHNHETGEIRGRLCSNCNTSLGGFQHNPEILQKAIDYLRKKPIIKMGLKKLGQPLQANRPSSEKEKILSSRSSCAN